ASRPPADAPMPTTKFGDASWGGATASGGIERLVLVERRTPRGRPGQRSAPHAGRDAAVVPVAAPRVFSGFFDCALVSAWRSATSITNLPSSEATWSAATALASLARFDWSQPPMATPVNVWFTWMP